MSANAESKAPSLTRNTLLDLGIRFPPDPAQEAEARVKVDRVVSKELPRRNSVLASTFASISHKVYHNIPGLDTWALAAGADRQPVAFIQPEWTNTLDNDASICFVAAHEPYHDLLHHLRDGDLGLTDDRSKENLRIAQDAMINYLLIKLGFTMPTIDGRVTGIDPVNMFKWVKDKCKKHDIDAPGTITEFYRNESVVFSFLESIPDDRRGGTGSCSHGTGVLVPGEGGSGADGEGSMPEMELPRDETAMGSLVEQSLELAIHQAIHNGDEAAKAELGALIDISEGSEKAEALWGSLGAYAVRGTVPKKRQSRDWFKFVAGFVGRRLSPERSRMQYNRKIPFDPRISPKGRAKRKVGYVGIDVSGSMPQETVTSFVDKLGVAFPELEIIAIAWDGKAQLLELGWDVHGGGGTQFECFDDLVMQHVAETRNDPDFILCITDGIFAPPALQFPADLYAFVITPGGTPFMKEGYTAKDGQIVPALQTFVLDTI